MSTSNSDPPERTPKPQADAAAPRAERRSRDRVEDNQQSGQGSASALSKLLMVERRRAAVTPKG